MTEEKYKKIGVLLVLSFIGWALCGATVGIGMAVTTELNALIIHAILGPVIFGVISLVYFKRFNYTTPLQTAGIFIGFIVFMDFFLVSTIIMKSYEMFYSILGTWLPWTLIFGATYLTGDHVTKNDGAKKVNKSKGASPV